MSEYYWIPDGCIPDLPDFRDWVYVPSDIVPPVLVDLRHLTSVIEDQGQIGSCTANAVIGAIEMLINKLGRQYTDLSRLFIFYNTRTLQGTITNGDIMYGSSIRESIKTCVDIGVCTEEIWPYVSLLWNIMPSCAAYENAIEHRVVNYYTIDNTDYIVNAIAEGYGVVFGIPLHIESFHEAGTIGNNIIHMPLGISINDLIGHAMVIVGYNSDAQQYIVRNSWGTAWGDNGYCYMDFDYIHLLGFNFWIIKNYYGEITPDVPPGDLVPLMITPQPTSGNYQTEQLLSFFVNKTGEIRVSVNGGIYFTYNEPIVIVQSCEIEYYFKYADGRFSDKRYISYIIDPVPMVVTPIPPSGTYRQVELTFNTNIPGDVYLHLANDLVVKYNNNNPMLITSNTDIIYYGISSLGTVYNSKVVNYVIDPNHIVECSITPGGKFYKPIEIVITALEPGEIIYYYGSEPSNIITYTEPFTIDSTCEIYYKHINGTYEAEAYSFLQSGMLYRINGGPWIVYDGPVQVSKWATIEGVYILEDGSFSDINKISYTITNANEYWVIIA